MSNYKSITKSEFDAFYNTHPPNGWIKFAYKYFSKETEKKDLVLKHNLIFLLLGLFFIGFFSTAFNLPIPFIKISTLAYAAILSILVIYLFSAVVLNNLRIKKIRKALKVNKNEYNYLVNKFYG